jgi:hypothetical protein
MTQQGFKKEIERLNEKFQSFWNEGQKLYPSQFPDELEVSDWWEQFMAYTNGKLDQ